MTSLKPMQIKTSDEMYAHGRFVRLLRNYKGFGFILVPLVLFLAFFDGNIGSGRKGNRVCNQECSLHRDQRYKHFQGRDILNTKDLLTQVTDEKRKLIQKLNVDYGEENFEKIFMGDDGKVRPFAPFSDKSLERLKLKLMIKVLSAQNKLIKKESAFNGCDCINGDVGIRHNPSVETKKSSEGEGSYHLLETSFEKYIWATGGHSAAAGHGNLYNESYTAYMERDLKDVFGSIGIDFKGRNYAMGGTGSAAEIAMCWDEIFGDDIDFFSWDYGMTDAGEPLRLIHYAYRGALSAGRPAFMGIRVNLDRGRQEQDIKVFDNNGIPIFFQDNEQWADMRKGIPDTLGLSTDEIDAMPEYVRNYKCNGVIEKGEPFCDVEKYSSYMCPERRGQAPWHPGIKTHAMVGHSLALFLIDSLLSALKELSRRKYESVEILLNSLMEEDDQVYEDQAKKINFDKIAGELYSVKNSDVTGEIDLDTSVFFKEKGMCHTARLPSRTRYLGYLTNTNKIGGPAPCGKEMYDVGIQEGKTVPNSDTMQLVWTDDKMHQFECPVEVNVDYKDSFFSSGDRWNSLVVPNEAERTAYKYNPEELLGIVVVVFTSCDWDDCEESYIGPKDFNGDTKKWKMKINGTPVKSLVDIGHRAFVAKGEDGIRFPPSPSNDYKFEIKVDDASKHVKVSAFVVY